MKMEELRHIAKDKGVLPGRLKKADLIREIQRTEGNQPCFGTGFRDRCGQEQCLWRNECS